jgi:hypothetical protein
MHPFTTEMLSAEVPDSTGLSVQVSVQAEAKVDAVRRLEEPEAVGVLADVLEPLMAHVERAAAC